MCKTTLEFLKKGLQTLVQDNGRLDHRASGVPIGGALDKSSMLIANNLVRNEFNSPVLEMTIAGPTIRFVGDNCIIAVTGADISPAIDGDQIEMYRSIRVVENDILSFGKLNSGCRAYLAVRGNWQVRKWLSSASAIFSDLTDVTPDSYIVKGSTLTVAHDGKYESHIYPDSQRPEFRETIIVRVVPGPEIDMFDDATLAHFFSTKHLITPSSNRWGYRLDGKFQTHKPGKELISSGVFPGVIQIPHSGGPIILMADAQTTGGYPRIAVVVNADLDKLAQAKPGDSLEFRIMKQ